eukprot:403352055
MFYGFLLNYSWILTSVAMILSTLGYFLFYGIVIDFHDLTSFAQVLTYMVLTIYACYFYEKKLKLAFIQLYQIKTMNNELKILFDQLPEGIVLYNPESNKISLANSEFIRLFKLLQGNQTQAVLSDQVNQNNLGLSDQDTNADLDQCLTREVLKDYNFQEQSQGENSNMISILEASRLETRDDKYYQIVNIEENLNQNSQNNNNYQNNASGTQQNQEIINVKECQILYQNLYQRMIMIKNLTPIIRYEKLKVENHFFEMLTATVSHDMRTPLNAMTGLLNSLDVYINDTNGRRFLSIIRNSTRFMCFLVNDLLDFFQIRNGKFKKKLEWVDLNNSFRELIDMFSIGANEKGIQIFYEVSSDFPSQLYLDEQRTKQVLLNLLQNSLKFTFQGYIKVSVNFNEENQTLLVGVQDTGIGIKQEERSQLFTLFGKLESTAQINTSGIGLGLSICKTIVEMFEGRIWLDQEYNQGTKFMFQLRAKDVFAIDTLLTTERFVEESESYQLLRNQVSRREGGQMYSVQTDFSQYNLNESCDLSINLTTQDPPLMITKKLTSIPDCSCQKVPEILVVDDNIFNVITLQAILQMQFGYQSDKASNGAEAVQKVEQRFNEQINNGRSFCLCLKNQKYKIIFMDCNMPLMDGFQATLEIRKLEETLKYQFQDYQQIHIVALTAYSTDMFSKKCYDSGMNEFQTKPVSADAIKLVLEKYINQ